MLLEPDFQRALIVSFKLLLHARNAIEYVYVLVHALCTVLLLNLKYRYNSLKLTYFFNSTKTK